MVIIKSYVYITLDIVLEVMQGPPTSEIKECISHD